MILLDTSYLILALVQGSDESATVGSWLGSGEMLCTAAVVWYEFLCGPVNDEAVELARVIIEDRVLPFTSDQAVESARLYNAAGRQRHLRVDAMVAAAAVLANSDLATSNADDFKAFTPYGLRLSRS